MLFCLSHVSACENHMENVFHAELSRRLSSVFSILSGSVKRSWTMEADSAVIVERSILKRCLEVLNKVEHGKFNCLQGFGSNCT